ncbi:hypothetical protein GX50_01331 [[Emmonsia] crescens]|uniref:Uncharacterized protein n=1 Tax=[Emmonsia] crescens TaxID=73230 RepID=A0A2B7ZRQ2_9EURO|nr:hypothetical protein GX50_01331 [Emmonsia crescens]
MTVSSNRKGAGMNVVWGRRGIDIASGRGELPVVLLRPHLNRRDYDRVRKVRLSKSAGREIIKIEEESNINSKSTLCQSKKENLAYAESGKQKGLRRIAELQESAVEREELSDYCWNKEKEGRTLSGTS